MSSMKVASPPGSINLVFGVPIDGLTDGDIELEGLTEDDGETDADGLTDGDLEELGETDADGEREAEGDTEGDIEFIIVPIKYFGTISPCFSNHQHK